LDCLAIGDSLTSGLFASTQDLGYFPRVTSWLALNGLACSEQMALSGGTIADAAAQADRIADTSANLASVELGNNDASEKTGATLTPIEEFERDYRSVLAAVMSANPSTKLVLVGIWKQTSTRGAYDAVIRRLAHEVGGRFVALGVLSSDKALSGPRNVLTFAGVSDDYHPNNLGHAAIAQRIKEVIATWYGFDASPPRTSAAVPRGWQRGAVTVRLRARPTGSEVTGIIYRVDTRTWHTGNRVSVTGSGTHRVRFYSVDTLGNTEMLRSCAVRIDNEHPSTRALSGAVSASRGAVVQLKLRLNELVAPRCLVRLQVLKGGVPVVTTRIGSLKPGAHTVHWRCDLMPGAYRYRFLATDLAGNTQASALAGSLKVR